MVGLVLHAHSCTEKAAYVYPGEYVFDLVPSHEVLFPSHDVHVERLQQSKPTIVHTVQDARGGYLGATINTTIQTGLGFPPQ